MSPGLNLSSHPECSRIWQPLMAVDSRKRLDRASIKQTVDLSMFSSFSFCQQVIAPVMKMKKSAIFL
jgi:hypothetical protein